MWNPMQKIPTRPELDTALNAVAGSGSDGEASVEVWVNDRYEVFARTNAEGMVWLSIKTKDRSTDHDWRHLQQIKNEVCGPEREAVELYPAESRLADTANEYHLWVLPEGMSLPLGFQEGLVSDDEQTEAFNAEAHNGQQRPWEEGLTTGRNEATRYMTEEQQLTVAQIAAVANAQGADT